MSKACVYVSTFIFHTHGRICASLCACKAQKVRGSGVSDTKDEAQTRPRPRRPGPQEP